MALQTVFFRVSRSNLVQKRIRSNRGAGCSFFVNCWFVGNIMDTLYTVDENILYSLQGVSDMDNNGIIELKHKSCASLTIQCLAETGIEKPHEIFERHIGNAKALGLMPDDLKVIRATLSDYGFIMQNSHIENYRFAKVAEMLSGNLNAPATVLISLRCYEHMGGYMLALQTDNTHGFKIVCPDSRPKHLESREVLHVWIRWADEVDRSPYPRKIINRRSSARRERNPKGTDYYQHFQPNPCDNYIGDCVVRGVSGVLNIAWCEALDLLASFNEPTINSKNIYPKLLEREGFIYHKAIVRNGRRLTGAEFCREMDGSYHNGERIFAHVGRSHVAAIVPTEANSKYKVIDSWDSSQRNIGEYWVKPVISTPYSLSDTQGKDSKAVNVGDIIRHPSFGVGVVKATSSGVLTVDFVTNDTRRLGEEWVLKNCIHAVVE